MNSHRNAGTTPFSRALIVEHRLSGESVDVIAVAFGISVRTVYKWLSRHRTGGTRGWRMAQVHPPGLPGLLMAGGLKPPRSCAGTTR